MRVGKSLMKFAARKIFFFLILLSAAPVLAQDFLPNSFAAQAFGCRLEISTAKGATLSRGSGFSRAG